VASRVLGGLSGPQPSFRAEPPTPTCPGGASRINAILTSFRNNQGPWFKAMRNNRLIGLPFAFAALIACAAHAAVVRPLVPHPELQGVADRVHALAVLVQAQAPIELADKTGRVVHTATQSASSGVLMGGGVVLTDLRAVAMRIGDRLQAAPTINVQIDGVGSFAARLIGADASSGVAVLRLPDAPGGLAGAALAKGDPLAGDAVLALGIDGRDVTAVGVVLEQSSDKLQTRQPLPEQFWGGPLFDAHGDLVGLALPAAGTPLPATPAAVPDQAPDEGRTEPVPASTLRALVERATADSKI
jgi:S1-C subfamily serine protease